MLEVLLKLCDEVEEFESATIAYRELPKTASSKSSERSNWNVAGPKSRDGAAAMEMALRRKGLEVQDKIHYHQDRDICLDNVDRAVLRALDMRVLEAMRA